jgi:hypothetical protein
MLNMFLRPHAPQKSERGVPRDLRQPPAQMFGLPEIAELSPGGQKRLLRRIFTRGKISQDTQRNPAHHRLVPAYNLDKRPLIPPPRRQRQLDVLIPGSRCRGLASVSSSIIAFPKVHFISLCDSYIINDAATCDFVTGKMNKSREPARPLFA